MNKNYYLRCCGKLETHFLRLFQLSIVLLVSINAQAQINFTGTAYSQNFDGLASSGTANAFTNGTAPLVGWFLYDRNSNNIATYSAGTGSGNAGAFYSFGTTGSTDRALGGLGSGGAYFGSPATGAIAGWIAVAFTNGAGANIETATIGFDGEQWRNGGNTTAQPMVLEYGFGATFAEVTTWTAPGGNFDWTSPVATATAAAVDGNSAGLVAARGGTLENLSWTSGTTLWIRWIERNDPGTDHGLAIDNFSFSAVVPGGGLPTVSITATDAVAAEEGNDPGTFRISRTGSTDEALMLTYTIGGTATNGVDYTPTLSGNATIAIGQAFTEITIIPVDDDEVEGNETVILTLQANALFNLGASSATVTIADNDFAIVKIHDVQGSGNASPLVGQTVTIEAIVTAVHNGLSAFFVQEEDADADADPATSEGLFIFRGSANHGVAEGDKVMITGPVSEFFGMTQITANTAASVTIIGNSNPLPTPTSIALPLAPGTDVNAFYEKVEGMLLTFPQKMVVSEYFQLSRYGQIVLTEGSRPYQYSHVDNTPTALENAAYLAELSRRRIILDDETNQQNFGTGTGAAFYPQPGGFKAGTQGVDYFRGGDAINNLTGVLHWSFAGSGTANAWRIRPVSAYPAQFTVENPRPATPTDVGGNIKVASFNVLNYFTTLNMRGADNALELERQTTKLVQALLGTGADVLGLMEIENSVMAISTLTDALNAIAGAGTYSFINNGVVGTDEITCAIIYKTNVVTPQGAAAVLNAPAFTDPNNLGGQQNRPAIAATFMVTDVNNPDAGGKFTVVVNHLKSKGGGGPGLDADQGDGQGAFNSTRTKAAQALAEWLATDPTGSGDPDFLIIGDLNAYKGEDPITTLKNAGYTELIEELQGNNAYGYLFDGQLGYLDHALSNNTLTPQVTGVTDWHINADEVNLFDYNTEFKPAGIGLFEENAFRTSDHDPVIIGLDLTVPCMITCPADIVADAEDGKCEATVTFAVTSSGDCGDISYSHEPGSAFPVGSTTVTATAASGETCSFTVTVNDKQAPVIHTITGTTVLFPVNHAYQRFSVADFVTSVTDNCSALTAADVVITKVTSDEPENGDNDGNTLNDMVIGAGCKEVDLRRERNGTGNGRVYTIYLSVTDEYGNTGTAQAQVLVPVGKKGMAIEDDVAYTVTATCDNSRKANIVANQKLTLPEPETETGETIKAYPNPASSITTIRYQVAELSKVALVIRNSTGQMVEQLVNGIQPAGTYQVQFDAGKQPAGFYIYSLQTINNQGKPVTAVGKLMIVK